MKLRKKGLFNGVHPRARLGPVQPFSAEVEGQKDGDPDRWTIGYMTSGLNLFACVGKAKIEN